MIINDDLGYILEDEDPDILKDEFSEEDRVAPHLGCPACGETRIDYLQILEDAEHDVFCLTCDTGYNHPAGPEDEDFPLTNTVAADEPDGVLFAIAHELGEL